MIDKLGFLLGDWRLDYRVPESSFSGEATGEGSGTFKKALDDAYVFFDYEATLTNMSAKAHGIFAWEEKSKIYRYWWFESSGNFLTATCNFSDENTLFFNWHDSLLVQTFTKKGPDEVILHMKNAAPGGEFELILEVLMSKLQAVQLIFK